MCIEKNLKNIREQMIEACNNSNRNISDITLIAVTKTKPVEMILKAIQAGSEHLGENKVQEIIDKYPEIAADVKWHMIGHLQTNKIKYIIDKVELIHSVDSLKLAQAIDKEAKKINKVQNILIQVNMAREESKFGIDKNDTENIICEISKLNNLRIKGLMTVAPFVENPEENRPIFKEMLQLYIDINSKNIDNVVMDTLSMGMTNDFAVAIEEGATMVRIGTAIFGHRN